MKTRAQAPDTNVGSAVFKRPLADAVDTASFPASQFSVGEVLAFLAHARKTGTLRIWQSSECLVLNLRNGFVVDVSFEEGPLSDRIGQILIEQGAVSRRALTWFVAQQAPSHGRLGRALRKARLINRKRLGQALKEQLLRGLARSLVAEGATVEFSRRENPYGSVDIHVDLHWALLEATTRATGPGR